jgi:hypothetical protein
MTAPARLVTACTWLIGTAAAATTGCRLEPIANPPQLAPDAGVPSRRLDAAIVSPSEGTPPNPAGNDAAIRVSPGDGGGEAGRDPDRPTDGPSADLGAPDLAADSQAPDLGPDATPADPNAGLVARWSFDEGMGASAADVTGNGHTATLHNGAAWERSAVPRSTPTNFAVRLDGSNDYLSMPVDNSYPRIQDPKSISFWFAADADPPPNPGSNQRTCVALVNPGMTVGIQVGTDRNRPAAWSWGQNQGFVLTDDTPGPGAHHLAYTFDGNTHRLYLDGVQADAATNSPQQGRATNLYVGTYDPPSELCAGQIDDLRIYSRALTAADVAMLAAAP